MRIPVSGGELACELLGSGEPVIFAHGFPISGLMWMHTAAHLPAGFRGIVPDLRGHGRSSVSPTLSIARLADDLIEVLDVLAPGKPAIFVGLSLGGIVCFDLWRRHAGRVRALVLTCTRANPESPEGIVRRRALAAQALREGSAPLVDAMVQQVFAPTFDPALRAFWRGVMLATPATTLAAASLALADRPDSLPTLPTITCPTLVIAGAQDVISTPQTLQDIHARIPGSRLVTIPACGHVPPVEQPLAYSAAINGFLSTL